MRQTHHRLRYDFGVPFWDRYWYIMLATLCLAEEQTL